MIAVEKKPFIPEASGPHNTSPGVAPELFIRLAKYLFSFLLKFTANIFSSNAANVFKDVAEGGSYLPIEDITSPELAVKEDNFHPSFPS